MTEFTSHYSIGDTVRFGEIEAVVTDLWWEGFNVNPKIRVQWFTHGEQRETWIREQALIALISASASKHAI